MKDPSFNLEILKYFLGMVFIVCATGGAVAAVGLFKAPDMSAQVFTNLTRQSGLLHIITVGAVSVIVFFLGLAGALGTEAINSILSAIIGFVLGSLSHEKTAKP
jgi:hypothetical protein